MPRQMGFRRTSSHFGPRGPQKSRALFAHRARSIRLHSPAGRTLPGSWQIRRNGPRSFRTEHCRSQVGHRLVLFPNEPFLLPPPFKHTECARGKSAASRGQSISQCNQRVESQPPAESLSLTGQSAGIHNKLFFGNCRVVTCNV